MKPQTKCILTFFFLYLFSVYILSPTSHQCSSLWFCFIGSSRCVKKTVDRYSLSLLHSYGTGSDVQSSCTHPGRAAGFERHRGCHTKRPLRRRRKNGMYWQYCFNKSEQYQIKRINVRWKFQKIQKLRIWLILWSSIIIVL